MYHGVSAAPLPFHNWCFVTADAFRQQMAYLKRHVDVIPLADALAPRASSRPAAVITFDDGYRNNFDVALPILREFELPATVFLTTGLVGSADTVWDGRLYLALCETDRSQLDWEGASYRWQSPAELAGTFRALKNALKEYAGDPLQDKMREIVRQLGRDPDEPVPEDSPVRMLNGDEIAAMAGSGLIEFGAHTHHHTILSLLDAATKREEIERSVIETARLSSKPCTLFAYPNGTPADYDTECLRILEAAGIQAAVTTIEAPNRTTVPPLELRRYGIGGGLPMARFQLKVHHVEYVLRRLMR